MRTTDYLHEEHRLISAMLRRFEDELGLVRARGSIENTNLMTVLAFLQREVDGQHQEKEERVLFDRLLRRTRGDERRLVESLFEEHSEERRCLEAVSDNLEGTAYGEALCLDRLVFHARKYLQLQRGHMRKEESVLFPLIESVFTPEDDREVLAGFRRVGLEWGLPLAQAAHRAARDLGAA